MRKIHVTIGTMQKGPTYLHVLLSNSDACERLAEVLAQFRADERIPPSTLVIYGHEELITGELVVALPVTTDVSAALDVVLSGLQEGLSLKPMRRAMDPGHYDHFALLDAAVRSQEG